MMDSRLKLIQDWLLQLLAEMTVSDPDGNEHEVFLVDIEVHSNKTIDIIEVFADTDSGISVENCKFLSKHISAELDASEEMQALLPRHFKLVVSSPGLSRPLTMNRQYKKNIGRLMQVTYQNADGEIKTIDGRFISLEEEAEASITLDITKIQKSKPNAKPKPPELVTIPFSQIQKAIVQVEF
ncbi:protein of unknown function DUF150 [Chloroherpeton thalassium ATCC 35110]|uniref:Ribosome maturation factor RimP n=1 Tax=Chloroherpeton thalassium (strain ATCC 35110 / GB-78) TaxID=517418 RepID=RIMP_CHLT3|nr:ribosome maturation factor RimP [Chloroherpeton thalassium]B3QUN0.1 RecName: Full=Ribosome maturation factor RimP [Chloroherpeton thalassium ATCC 35110]ACF12936.1 protein of unknown function DUF150 [Chloroherpeton thalassium ATCC 35110]